MLLLDHINNGDPDVIRTRGPQIRNLVLYPAELRDHSKGSRLVAWDFIDINVC